MSTGRLGAGDNAIQSTLIDAKGDLITATAADTPARLAVGSNGQYLKADSTAATGLSWATLPASGKVLQVIQDDAASNFTTTSSTYTDTGLSVSITPSSSSSKVLVMANIPAAWTTNGAGSIHNYSKFNLVRGTTQLQVAYFGTYNYASSNNPEFNTPVTLIYLDSPATTSATTYKVQGAIGSSASCNYTSSGTVLCSIVVMEIGA